MKLPFKSRAPAQKLRKPLPSVAPPLATAQVGARYRVARKGGDFFDYAAAGTQRLLVLLLDIAGEREKALDIAAAVQDIFRNSADLMMSDEVNEPVALTHLLLDINRTIMEAANGVCHAPGFMGCYNELLGTLAYINAGHTPALLKDRGGINVLEANGLPLGLFSHATHDAQVCAMPSGSALVLVSRGLIEVKAGGEEYGLERVKAALQQAPMNTPDALCTYLLDDVKQFVESKPRHRLLGGRNNKVGEDDPLGVNDTTALALLRATAAVAKAT
jgi:serine phosphatase RsbU (regulator of sigma subunit)